MIFYQKIAEEKTTNESFERTARNSSYLVLSQVFDPFVFDQMVTIDGINRPDNNPPSRTYDPHILKDIAFYVHQIKGSMYYAIA